MLTQPAQNKPIMFLTAVGVSLIIAGFITSGVYYQDKILPNTTLGSISLSSQTKSEALSTLEQNHPQENIYISPAQKITFVVDDIILETSAANIGLQYNYEELVESLIEQSRQTPLLKRAMLAITQPENKVAITPTYSIEDTSKLLEEFAKKIDLSGKKPSIDLQKDQVVVFIGEPNRKLKVGATLERLSNHLIKTDRLNDITIEAFVSSPSAVLTPEYAAEAELRAKKLIGSTITLEAEAKKTTLTSQEIIQALNPMGGQYEEALLELTKKLTEKLNQPTLSAEFEYDPKTLEVKSFTPHQNGVELIIDETTRLLDLQIARLGEESEPKQITIPVPHTITKPEKTLAETNSLGIVEEIGFGESSYTGSIPNRIHNVGITSDKISLTIVPPKTEFSFNKTVGEISSRTGYKSAYVISGGRTVLGDGGGVCQVSSTLFRAVLDAGLDVTKRLQHSYRVSYYELNSEPGFDATVYSGAVDFRFINDSPNHILIESSVDSKSQYMSIRIYGTNDGRTSEISNYKKWDQRAPLAPEYYPTTDLPSGKLQQIDWAVGGIKTEFTHTVTNKDGSVRQKDVYYSNYRPWSAKYLRGV